MGSPPHARGKEKEEIMAYTYTRITPARAGKSDEINLLWDNREDHPRTRGEKSLTTQFFRAHQGSPPHARGKVLR